MQNQSYQVCRLCLQSMESEVDVTILNRNDVFLRMIKELLSIEILEDFSQDYFICSSCQQTLHDFDSFREKCQENDTIFRNQLQSTSIPIKDSNDEKQDTASTVEHSVKLEIESHDLEIYPPDEVCSEQLNDKRKHMKAPCTECGKMVSKNNMAVHLGTHQECRARYPCVHCDKVYTDANNLKKHVNTHTRAAIYPCEICGKSFDRTDSLGKHRKIMHSDERNHVCPDCGKGYALKQSLTQHLKSAHSNVKTKECKDCGMLFKFNNELKMHMIKHTKERQHPCPMCSKQFTRAYYLNVHVRTIHSLER